MVALPVPAVPHAPHADEPLARFLADPITSILQPSDPASVVVAAVLGALGAGVGWWLLRVAWRVAGRVRAGLRERRARLVELRARRQAERDRQPWLICEPLYEQVEKATRSGELRWRPIRRTCRNEARVRNARGEQGVIIDDGEYRFNDGETSHEIYVRIAGANVDIASEAQGNADYLHELIEKQIAGLLPEPVGGSITVSGMVDPSGAPMLSIWVPEGHTATLASMSDPHGLRANAATEIRDQQRSRLVDPVTVKHAGRCEVWLRVDSIDSARGKSGFAVHDAHAYRVTHGFTTFNPTVGPERSQAMFHYPNEAGTGYLAFYAKMLPKGTRVVMLD